MNYIGHERVTFLQDGTRRMVMVARYLGTRMGTQHVFSLRPLAGTQVVDKKDIIKREAHPGPVSLPVREDSK